MVKFKRHPMNTPKSLPVEEWKEITEIPTIKESWGLTGDESP